MTELTNIWPNAFDGRQQLLVTLVLDVETSLPDSFVAELRTGIRQVDLLLQKSPELRHCVVLTLIAPRWMASHLQLQAIRCEPTRAMDGDSTVSMSLLIDGVLDAVEKRSAGPFSTQSKNFPHWLVVLSTGGSDHEATWIRRIGEQVRNKALTVIPVILGEGDDSALLSATGPYRPPLRLQNGRGPRFFSWLGKELLRVVRAKPGRRVFLDVAGIAAWAQT